MPAHQAALRADQPALAADAGQALVTAAALLGLGRGHRGVRRPVADPFQHVPGAGRPRRGRAGRLDRALLERYLAWLATSGLGPGAKEDAVTGVGMFFQAVRQHNWDPTLSTTAVFFAGDLPPRPSRVTRHLAEHVMAQVEATANLDRWPNLEGRLVTLILMQCGLRATDACMLSFNCLLHDGQGAPYLRYLNHKMRREAAVPIDADLEREIRAQQQRVADRWPGQHPHLFPQLKGNVGGQRPLSYYSYRGMLNTWLALCQVHDEHGQPVHLTPHQWRHTFACRLINRDVPQEVVRVLLDHESTQMTAHYARITDQTVRRRWEAATKVNINGERIDIDPDGPLAQAQWAKTRYGMATQTLPHGYCGLPVQKSCPHANACLTCPVFLTGPEFLPELREHRGRTLTLIDEAKAHGHARVAQMNTEALANPDTMIAEIDKEPSRAAPLTPQRQRATEASLLRRLEATSQRMRHLEEDNRQLRQALAEALGSARTAQTTGKAPRRDTPGQQGAEPIGPR